MYLLLIGTERCCDVVMMLLLVVVLSSVCGCARVCVCGGDGCVGDTGDTGDTTNADKRLYDVPCDGCVVVGVRLAGRLYVL